VGRRFDAEPELDAITGLVLPEELETEAQLLFEQWGAGRETGFRPVTYRLASRSGSWLHRLISIPMVERQGPEQSQSQFSLYATGELGLGSNMAFRANALRALGGFDCSLGVGTATCGGEDVAILLDLLMSGRALGHEPAAIVHHRHRRTLEELELQLRGYGIGFGAMMTSLMCRDSRHLRGILAAAPQALRALADPDSAKRSGRSAQYPGSLARAEVRGMLIGPAAYLKERRSQRKWTRTVATSATKECPGKSALRPVELAPTKVHTMRLP
jgi:hypothetical protein